jgi:hypothetical protein
MNHIIDLGEQVAYPPIAIPIEEPIATCKVCQADAILHGVVDMSKSCRELDGLLVYHMLGAPVYYYRCAQCGFLFTKAFDYWDNSLYSEWIYDEGYINVDPDYKEVRPKNFARFLSAGLDGNNTPIVGLDYGGGNGVLAQELSSACGIVCESWDPMLDSTPPKREAYDLITAIEVVEHTPDPGSMFRSVAKLLRDHGVFFFTTLTSDTIQPNLLMNWWYVAPMNGHISIMTTAALDRLCADVGLTVIHEGGNHFAHRGDSPLCDMLLNHYRTISAPASHSNLSV